MEETKKKNNVVKTGIIIVMAIIIFILLSMVMFLTIGDETQLTLALHDQINKDIMVYVSTGKEEIKIVFPEIKEYYDETAEIKVEEWAENTINIIKQNNNVLESCKTIYIDIPYKDQLGEYISEVVFDYENSSNTLTVRDGFLYEKNNAMEEFKEQITE